MSRYEEAVRIIAECDAVIAAFRSQETTRDRDKTGLRWMLESTPESRSIKLQTEMYAGYYGDSSVYDKSTPGAAELLADVLTALKPQIIAKAVAICEERKRAAAAGAADEARRVLSAGGSAEGGGDAE